MNQDMAGEELDRELALRHGPAYCDSPKVKIGKRALSLFHNAKSIHPDYEEKNTRVTFTKSLMNGESLAVRVEWNELQYDTCSLGHKHVKNKVSRMSEQFHIDWSHVDQLIEWIQLGSWREIQCKPDPAVKLLRDLREFLESLAAREKEWAHWAKIYLKRIKDLDSDTEYKKGTE